MALPSTGSRIEGADFIVSSSIAKAALSFQEARRARSLRLGLAGDEESGLIECGAARTPLQRERRWEVLPLSPEVAQSPLVRKLAAVAGGGKELVIAPCSDSLALQLRRAHSWPANVDEMCDSLAAHDYLLATVTTQRLALMLHFVLSPLMRVALVIPPGALLCDRHENRLVFDVAVARMEATQPVLHAALLVAGYDAALSASVFPAGGDDPAENPRTESARVGYRPTPHSGGRRSTPSLQWGGDTPDCNGDDPSGFDYSSLLRVVESARRIVDGCYLSASGRLEESDEGEENCDPASSLAQITGQHIDAGGAACSATVVSPRAVTTTPRWPRAAAPQMVGVCRPWEQLVGGMARDALDSVPDYKGGPLYVLRNTEELMRVTTPEHLNWLHWRAIRALYAEEACATSVAQIPVLSLNDVAKMHRSYMNKLVDIENFLPFCRDVSRPVYSLPPAAARSRAASLPLLCDEAALRNSLRERVPWLGAVWEVHPDLWVTGGLLLETLARPRSGASVCASDVDLFSDRLGGSTASLDCVFAAMSSFASAAGLPAPVLHVKGEARYCVSIGAEQKGGDTDQHAAERREILRALRAHDKGVAVAALTCDLYPNTAASVARYHLPVVRMAVSLRTTFLVPSCAIGLATGVNVDYHYFCSRTKTPFDVIAKKWRAGFNFIVSRKEQRLLWTFLSRTGGDTGLADGTTMRPLDGCYFYLHSWASRNAHYVSCRQDRE
jgi:hypothetical protein